MRIVHTIAETREIMKAVRAQGKSVGFVPTMGYLHEGHLSIMRQARKENNFLVVSIFVNPIQFGPKEDLAAYPQDLERDGRLAEEVGVDLIFNPSAEEMYPEGYHTYVDVEKYSGGLCGASREGHFRGVSTVVLKLFNIVQPDGAYFGRKDYQQLKVIEHMAKDLNVPVEVTGCPTVREADGLAMSSRNVYLNPQERQAALILSKALKYGQELLDQGVTSGWELSEKITEYIEKEPLAQVEYVSIVEPDSLDCQIQAGEGAVLALAVRIGRTRLIDNTVLRGGMKR